MLVFLFAPCLRLGGRQTPTSGEVVLDIMALEAESRAIRDIERAARRAARQPRHGTG